MTRPDKRRALALILAGALVLVAIRVIRVATTPDVAEICDHLLELARSAGEQPGEAEAAQCLEVMQARRDAAGRSGWADLSRCIALARSFDEAGRCKAP